MIRKKGVISIIFSKSLCCVCCRLTDEIREILAGFGSTMSRLVKKRDAWVFAGAAGIVKESPFEKV